MPPPPPLASALALLLLAARLDADQRVTPATNGSDPVDPVRTRKGDEEIGGNVTLLNETKSGFMPSFHLGTFPEPLIDLSGQAADALQFNFDSGRPNRTSSSSSSPFNNLRPIKFGNGAVGGAAQNQSEAQPPVRPMRTIENLVKFADEVNDPSSRLTQPNGDATAFNVGQRNGAVLSEHVISQSLPEDQYQNLAAFANEDETAYQHHVTYDNKPARYHDAHDYSMPTKQLILPAVHDVTSHYQQYPSAHPLHQLQHPLHQDANLAKPDMVINVHPISYQSMSLDTREKPSTYVYLTSHPMTRNHKPLYGNYFQPQIYQHAEPHVLPEHDEIYHYPLIYEQEKSISPWKKILHIIGAFLPLGLLLALLSPKVIGQAHTNEPNIILSKLRVNDLTAEHKAELRPALDTGPSECREQRSICHLIAGADSTSANLLRRLLRHVTDRTAAESSVRKEELDRIFEAAQQGNCDILTCNYYDGT